KDLGMEDAIHFVGLQTEVRPYFAAFDIYMMSSLFEGLPIAMLEAMSMGLPVVTTNAGGIGEVIRDGREGQVVGVDEWRQLAERVVSLIADADLRKALGAAARRRVVERFSMEQMVWQLEDVYKEVGASGR